MVDDPEQGYRPQSGDNVHVFLLFLAASVFVLAGGLDIAVRPLTSVRPGQVHLACLALAGFAGAAVVFEVRPIMLRARLFALSIVLDCVAAGVLRFAAWHYSALAALCFGISALLAISAAAGLRGQQWQAYLTHISKAPFLAF